MTQDGTRLYNHLTEPSSQKIALITGSSRGIGAAIAREFGKQGILPIIHCRDKESKAKRVSEEIRGLGGFNLTPPWFSADITNPGDVDQLFHNIHIQPTLGTLDFLILNAAGGLEQDKGHDYAEKINIESQVNLVNGAIRQGLLPTRQVVYITSHVACAWGPNIELVSDHPNLNEYLKLYMPIARSKNRGAEELQRLGLDLIIVSAPLVDNTPPILYLKHLAKKQRSDLFEVAKQLLGLVQPEDVAIATVNALMNPNSLSGNMVLVDEESFHRTHSLVKYM